MRRFHLAALGLALTLSLTACGGDDKDDDDERSGSTTSQGASAPASDLASEPESESEAPTRDVAADQEIADNAVLLIGDMPSGWTAEAPDDDDDDDSGDEELAECIGIDVDEFDDDDNVTAESDEFSSPDHVQISSEVSLAPDEDSAIKSLDIAGRPEFRDCMADQLQDEMAEDDEVEVGDISIDELPFDELGDDTVAFRVSMPMTVQGTSFSASIDFVIVRVDRGAVLMTGAGIGSPVDSEDLALYTAICVERLKTGLGVA